MAMNFEELDGTTRGRMLDEFETEEGGGSPYRGRGLSGAGFAAFSGLMRQAIADGDDDSLTTALAVEGFWNPTETYVRGGVARERRINVRQAAERLARNEFNTWYVRGFSKRLLDEGVERCQAYRAALPRWEPGECSEHEGQIYQVADIYAGHRACYWPEPGNPGAISIPFQPGCHHTIRRYH
jgi:hypothetical protein